MSTRIITVRVRAGARERSVAVGNDGILKVRTSAAPEKGRANEDVIAILAEHFGVPRSCVELLRGAGSKTKTFKITA